MNKRLKQAFTLIELLVVIAIIGILSGLIVVSMGGMTQKATIAKAQVFSNSLRSSLMLNTIAQYTFDDIADFNSSTRVVNSTMGNVPDSWASNEGRAYGGPILKEENDCVSGHCLFFDGVDDNIDCGNSDSLNVSNVITISLWFNSAGFSGLKGIISKMNYVSGTNKQGYYARFDGSGSLNFAMQNNALTNGGVSSTNLSLNRWYFVSMSFDSGAMKIYIDGSLNNQSTGQTSPATTTNPFKIGSTYGTSENFNGLIDDVRVFNSAISSFQIQEQYYAGLNSLLANGNITSEEYGERINSIALQ